MVSCQTHSQCCVCPSDKEKLDFCVHNYILEFEGRILQDTLYSEGLEGSLQNCCLESHSRRSVQT
jgi:hypothetical protein